MILPFILLFTSKPINLKSEINIRNRKNILHLMSICFRLNSDLVTEIFIEEIIDSLYELALTENEDIDLKKRVNRVREKIQCPK
jgi:hypothetical protein